MGNMRTDFETVIFSDFDGTITEEETFSLLMREFAPEASARMVPRLLSGEITLREGVPAVLETIPSALFPAMEERMRNARLREGFEPFLDTLSRRGIPLVVLSGSLELLVMATLAPYRDRILRVVSAEVDLSGEFLRVSSPYADRDELVYKPGILEEYGTARKIVIGDSVTDFSMARAGNLVFARSVLARKLDEESREYIKFETFFEISNFIESYLKNTGK
jgi:2-hydroxy-3-keto-5-methylthiopentenyl-1-phosphate phosphatase